MDVTSITTTSSPDFWLVAFAVGTTAICGIFYALFLAWEKKTITTQAANNLIQDNHRLRRENERLRSILQKIEQRTLTEISELRTRLSL